jgi:hypothetical protein
MSTIAVKTSVGASLLLFAIALGACADESLGLEDARARWQHAAITDYAFDYHTRGAAPRVSANIVVQGGAATAITDLGGSVGTLDPQYAPTIDSLFDHIAQEIAGSDDVEVTWDPALGFPVDAYFSGGSEGDGFKVSAFEPVTSASRSPAPWRSWRAW